MNKMLPAPAVDRRRAEFEPEREEGAAARQIESIYNLVPKVKHEEVRTNDWYFEISSFVLLEAILQVYTRYLRSTLHVGNVQLMMVSTLLKKCEICECFSKPYRALEDS